MESIDPAWVAAIATALSTAIALSRLRGVRRAGHEMYCALINAACLVARMIAARRRHLARVVILLLSTLWMPFVLFVFWKDLQSIVRSEVALIVIALTVSVLTALSARLLLQRKAPVRSLCAPQSKACLARDFAIEIDNDISVIQGTAEFLLSQPGAFLKSEKARKHVQVIYAASNRISRSNATFVEHFQPGESDE